jgi:polyisoprenoid-binding protein YceI
MKKLTIITAAVLILVGFVYAFTAPASSEWTLDKAHGKLGFTISHLMVSEVEGWFRDFDAKITSTKEDFSDAIVTMTAQAASINTDVEKRDADLRSSNYFDVAKYPTITFKSKTFKKINDQNYLVTGDLTMHGVTKPVELNAFCRTGTNPQSKNAVSGFKVTGKVKRLDFGIGTSAPVAMVGNDVDITANVEFIKNQSLSQK